MPKILSEQLAEKIEVTKEMVCEAQARMTDFHLETPEKYMNAFHDFLEAEAARLAYEDAFFLVTGRHYQR